MCGEDGKTEPPPCLISSKKKNVQTQEQTVKKRWLITNQWPNNFIDTDQNSNPENVSRNAKRKRFFLKKKGKKCANECKVLQTQPLIARERNYINPKEKGDELAVLNKQSNKRCWSTGSSKRQKASERLIVAKFETFTQLARRMLWKHVEIVHYLRWVFAACCIRDLLIFTRSSLSA